jgi:hypothetical protein
MSQQKLRTLYFLAGFVFFAGVALSLFARSAPAYLKILTLLLLGFGGVGFFVIGRMRKR